MSSSSADPTLSYTASGPGPAAPDRPLQSTAIPMPNPHPDPKCFGFLHMCPFTTTAHVMADSRSCPLHMRRSVSLWGGGGHSTLCPWSQPSGSLLSLLGTPVVREYKCCCLVIYLNILQVPISFFYPACLSIEISKILLLFYSTLCTSDIRFFFLLRSLQISDLDWQTFSPVGP